MRIASSAGLSWCEGDVGIGAAAFPSRKLTRIFVGKLKREAYFD